MDDEELPALYAPQRVGEGVPGSSPFADNQAVALALETEATHLGSANDPHDTVLDDSSQHKATIPDSDFDEDQHMYIADSIEIGPAEESTIPNNYDLQDDSWGEPQIQEEDELDVMGQDQTRDEKSKMAENIVNMLSARSAERSQPLEDDIEDDIMVDEDTNQNSVANSVEPSNGKVLYPIEVVLHPPIDPGSYRELSPSDIVDTIHREVEVDGEVLYEVEFSDGLIDKMAYDDLIQLENGERQFNIFQRDSRFPGLDNGMPRYSSRQRGPEDEWEESEDELERYSKRRKAYAPNVRRSQRTGTSRHGSSDLAPITSNFVSINDIDLEDDDDDDLEEKIPSRQSSRQKTEERPRRQTRPTQKYKFDDSPDELSQNQGGDSDYDMPFITSDVIANKSRRSQRKRKRPQAPAVAKPKPRFFTEDDSDIEFEVTPRRPQRSARSGKSMRDPEMDDDYEVFVEDKTSAPKIASIKEVFQPLESGSQFAAMHSSTCDSCQSEASNGRGALVYCQGCSLVYHKSCVGVRSQREHRVTKIAADSFVLQCRYCIGIYRKRDERAPRHARCQICKADGKTCSEFSTKKTPKMEERLREENNGEDPVTAVNPDLINNSDLVMFRCSSCKRGAHFACLPPITQTGHDAEDIKADRLEEYAMNGWKCKECLEAPQKPQGLVAWRPVDESSYRPGLTGFDFGEDSIEYLVKWENRSHFYDSWMPGAWVFGATAATMRLSFHKRETSSEPKMTIQDAVPEEYVLPDVLLVVRFQRGKRSNRVDDVSEALIKYQGLGYDESVYDSCPPEDNPWGKGPVDAFRAAFEEYLAGQRFPDVSNSMMKTRATAYRDQDFSKLELKCQPTQLQRGKLMDYQLEGVNWLLYKFHQEQNVILADEMGLGKTVQIVTFVTALALDKPECWPFLVVVPNATCPNWRREFKQWTPELRVVTYHGGKKAQQLAYDHELFPYGRQNGMRAHVVIMSYEAATNVSTEFASVKWAGLVVDEGQRLKNENSLLYKALTAMKIPCRILLTGTPLQNNKRELFNLLQFIDPVNNNADTLDEKYSELTKDNLPELHKLIRPYFLRRTKAQVLKFLPPMAQIILPVSMTLLQAKLCKSIMARNPDLIRAIMSKSQVKSKERKSLSNILMELRQCLCHPFCFNAEVEDKEVSAQQMHSNLVTASGKLLLLSIMLPKLKAQGHRVLIFSQFLHSLTIIEDFLTGCGLEHARIDGSLSALEKQKRIDAYNAPESNLFAMLLSTRAGGVGINLATADTVIIYDPDFNPHQDLQALSRAHRIGQKNKVLCFQFTTKNTVEEKIMQMGRKKMALDHALIESMDADDDAGEDLETILKHGAAALFGEDAKDNEIIYDSASVDRLLDRVQIESSDDKGNDESAENQFSMARVWANNEAGLVDDLGVEDDNADAPHIDKSVWENILKEREEEHQRELAAKEQNFGRGARRRTKGANYKDTARDGGESGSEKGADELYIDNDDDDSDEYEVTTRSGLGMGQPPMVTQTPVPLPPPPPPPVARPQLPAEPPKPRRRGRPPKNRPEDNLQPPRPPQRPAAAPGQAAAKPSIQMPGQMTSNGAPVHPDHRINQQHNFSPQMWVPQQQHHVQWMPQYQSPMMYSQQQTYPARPAQVPPTLPSQSGAPIRQPPPVVQSHRSAPPQLCGLCVKRHSPDNPCVDMNSKGSISIALDYLKPNNSPELAGLIADARKTLSTRLKELRSKSMKE